MSVIYNDHVVICMIQHGHDHVVICMLLSVVYIMNINNNQRMSSDYNTVYVKNFE